MQFREEFHSVLNDMSKTHGVTSVKQKMRLGKSGSEIVTLNSDRCSYRQSVAEIVSVRLGCVVHN